MRKPGWFALATMVVSLFTQPGVSPARTDARTEAGAPFTFMVTADQRGYSGPGTYDTPEYYRGACEAMAALGVGAFMVSPGDIDPPGDVNWTMEQTIGPGYLWYPVVGNHESETPSDMDWLRAHNLNGDTLPNIVNVGPVGSEETTYSFDYEDAHFVVLNQYFNGISDTGSNGDVVDALFTWLEDDLNSTGKRYTFVLGHEPAYPQPDEDYGRARHVGDSLDQHPVNRDRFWNLLRERRVTAYLCGHTHGYSAVKIDGVWQVDAGHARGAGDTGAPSTFVRMDIDEDGASFETYRDTHNGIYDYTDIVHTGVLAYSDFSEETLTFQDGVSPDSSYTGTRDTSIKSDAPDTNFGSSGNLEADGEPDYATIIQWDIASIPAGSTVTYASVTLAVTNNSGGQGYELYEMKRDWVEEEANWGAYSLGNPWQTAGADGPDDRGTTALGKAATSDEGLFVFALNADGIALVQSWIDDPAGNHGLILLDYGNTDGLDFESREAVSIENRPKLSIEIATHIALTALGTIPLGPGIQINWETASEIDNAGFNIWRSDVRNGIYTKINTTIIPAEGGAGIGAVYDYVDEDAASGATYYYKLEAVDVPGDGRFFGPVSETAAQAWGASPAQASTPGQISRGGSNIVNSLSMILPVTVFFLAWKGVRRRRRKPKYMPSFNDVSEGYCEE
jgi:hypothetical protein